MNDRKNADSSRDSKSRAGEKLKEAEVCQSMGLLEEALMICEEILENEVEIEEDKIRFVEEKIGKLKKEIEIQNREVVKKPPPRKPFLSNQKDSRTRRGGPSVAGGRSPKRHRPDCGRRKGV